MKLTSPETILFNGKITTLDAQQPEVTALAIAAGKIIAMGSDLDIKALATELTGH
jgi:hypothetical protein